MGLEEPKIKHQKCKICEHVNTFRLDLNYVMYYCWDDDGPKEVEPSDRCHKWTWNGVDEK